MSESEYRDEWDARVIFECGDTHVEVTLTFKQLGKMFFATDPFVSSLRGQGHSKEEAALDYLRKKLSNRDSEG